MCGDPCSPSTTHGPSVHSNPVVRYQHVNKTCTYFYTVAGIQVSCTTFQQGTTITCKAKPLKSYKLCIHCVLFILSPLALKHKYIDYNHCNNFSNRTQPAIWQ